MSIMKLNFFKFYINFIIMIVGLGMHQFGHAACTAQQSNYLYATLGDVVVQRDTPVGTQLKSYYITPNNQPYDMCTNGGYEYYQMSYPGTQKTSISNVYTTNIPGVGISVLNNGGGNYFTQPASARYISGTSMGINNAYTIVTLYKIGEITSGSLINTRIAVEYNEDGSSGLNVYLTGTNNVTVVACSLTTPSLTFPIGNVLASKFGNSVGTIPAGAQNTQNLGLNCDANANINVTLSGTQNADVSDTSVLALTGQGSSDVASGVGVQLLYNNSPLKLNNRIVLKKSSGGQETFPLVARYYQTKSTVTTGKANASATLDLTYQ